MPRETRHQNNGENLGVELPELNQQPLNPDLSVPNNEIDEETQIIHLNAVQLSAFIHFYHQNETQCFPDLVNRVLKIEFMGKNDIFKNTIIEVLAKHIFHDTIISNNKVLIAYELLTQDRCENFARNYQNHLAALQEIQNRLDDLETKHEKWDFLTNTFLSIDLGTSFILYEYIKKMEGLNTHKHRIFDKLVHKKNTATKQRALKEIKEISLPRVTVPWALFASNQGLFKDHRSNYFRFRPTRAVREIRRQYLNATP